MRALRYDAFRQPPTRAELPEPEPGEDGAVIEVRASGLCRSDWHAWMGHDPGIRLPHVPGHEFAGVVVAAGPAVRGAWLGARVTAPFCCGCGRCQECRAGHQNLCEREYQPGFDGDGSFAERVFVPHADVNLVRLPDALGFVEAAALGCRYMTSFAALVDKAGLRPGESLAVFGCGGIGLSAISIGAALGATVIALDTDDAKLERALALGAAQTVNVRSSDAVAAVREGTDGGAHVSVDAVGSGAVADQAVRSLRRRGRHAQVGLLLGSEAATPLPMLEVIKRELTVVGVHGMAVSRYGELLRFVARDPGAVLRLVGKRVTLDEAAQELAAMGAFEQVGVSVITRFAD